MDKPTITPEASERVKRYRIYKFIRLIWDDIGLVPKEIVAILAAAILIAAIVMIPIVSLAYFLAWITDQPFEDGAILASIGIWCILFAVVLCFNYLKGKWAESYGCQ